MANVNGVFNLEKALTRESYAYDCWVNKNYEDNTLRITNAQLKQIEEHYGQVRVSTWKVEAEKDHTEYLIEDDDFKAVYNDSQTQTTSEVEEVAGEDSLKVQKGNNAANIATATAGTVASVTLLACCVASTIAAPVIASVSFAVGLLYQVTKPNKEPYEALMELKTLMDQSNSELVRNQEQLNKTGDKTQKIAERAESDQEKKQQKLTEKTALLIMAQGVQQTLKERINNGEAISSSDKSLFNQAGSQITALAEEVNGLAEELQISSEEMMAEIVALSEDFKEKALNIANGMAQSDLAASFDEATRELAITEAITQSLNSASGFASGAFALYLSCIGVYWMIPFVALGFAGGGMSLAGTVEQSKFAEDILGEIEVRSNLQTTVEASLKNYDLNINKQTVNAEIAGAAGTLEGLDVFGTAVTESEALKTEFQAATNKPAETQESADQTTEPTNNTQSTPLFGSLTTKNKKEETV